MFPLNLPNVLTLVRMLMVPVVVGGLLAETTSGSVIAAAVFAVAVASDVLDGWLARSRQAVTTFGKVMDPVADKLLVVAAMLALVSLDRLAVWIAMVIIVREFAVTGLRVAVGSQGYVIPASPYGKAKTTLQVVAIFALIAAPDPGAMWIDALLGLAVAVTLVSGVDYFLNVRRREPIPPRVAS